MLKETVMLVDKINNSSLFKLYVERLLLYGPILDKESIFVSIFLCSISFLIIPILIDCYY